MKFSHWFLPHPHTHKKAHLISSQALIVYILLFVCVQWGLKSANAVHSGVLGISSSVDQKDLIRLTNVEREKQGLGDLTEDNRLDQAALEKGKNMFAENYWAHYSPSGKDPWGFIQAAGYQFSYAGENLARNFYTSQDVVTAWMNSPTHRENVVNSHYTNIGMAVLNGTLLGQPTILIVQEFGKPADNVVKTANSPPVQVQGAPANPQPKQLAESQPVQQTQGVSQLPTLSQPVAPAKVLVDSFSFTKMLSLGMLGFVAFLLILDMYILRRRAVVRLSSNHWAHFALIGVAATAIINGVAGSIL
jgi:hypothetical protein